MNTVKVGIIGIGNMGSAHLDCIVSKKINSMIVSAVCDIDDRKLKAVKSKYPQIDVFKSYSDLLANSDTDAVIISVPHPLHCKIAAEAFKSGKHVLVEKPIDVSVSAAKKLNEVARSSKKQFGIMFNQRTNALFQKARSIVKNGELGELKRSVWIITNWYRTQHYYDSGSWRATWRGEGGGVLLNQAPHNLDLWQWICGMPSSITAFCNIGKYHNIEVEDEATIYAEYPNGATGVFITSTGDCPGTNRFEITGTRGKLVLENGTMKFFELEADERDICYNSKNGFVVPKTQISQFECEKETAHAGILQNFTDAILYGKELLAPGYDGICELTISNAAYLSEWKDNKKVTIPFDTSEFDDMLYQKVKTSSVKDFASDIKKDPSCSERWRVNW